jgi:succinoglycan biosynthesis protein ExoL
LENKVLLIEDSLGLDFKADPRIGAGPPWRIGWFGMLRCRKSLDILGSLARKASGAVEIVIRGRPSDATLADLTSRVSPMSHVHFAGPYRSHDLSTIYGDVHFSWAIDYFEEGQNSDWLLPNRIYESALFGAVPLALSKVASGRWLAKRGVGVLLDEPVESAIGDFIGRLSSNHYLKLAQQLRTLPRRDLIAVHSDCRELVEAL